MSYVFGAISIINTATNYSLINTPNLFNIFIHVLKELDNDNKRIQFIEEIRLQMGLTWFESFKSYVAKKYSHDHAFNRLLNTTPTEIQN